MNKVLLVFFIFACFFMVASAQRFCGEDLTPNDPPYEYNDNPFTNCVERNDPNDDFDVEADDYYCPNDNFRCVCSGFGEVVCQMNDGAYNTMITLFILGLVPLIGCCPCVIVLCFLVGIAPCCAPIWACICLPCSAGFIFVAISAGNLMLDQSRAKIVNNGNGDDE